MQFLDVKTDFAFKKVFGSEQSKGILISFLNATIYGGEARILGLTIMDPYQIPMVQGVKDSYVDVKALLDGGTQVLIEMQVLNVAGLEQRILYNAAKSYSTQLEHGDKFADLTPIIALTLTDFVMFSEHEAVRSCYRMKEVNRNTEYKNQIELIFFELPKFRKKLEQLVTLEDKWLYFVKMAGKLEVRPAELEAVGEISRAMDIADESKLSPQEHDIQYKRRDFIMQQKGAMEKSREEGREEGRAEGIQKGVAIGEAKARAEMIQKMHESGMAMADIAKISQLTMEQVEMWLKRSASSK